PSTLLLSVLREHCCRGAFPASFPTRRSSDLVSSDVTAAAVSGQTQTLYSDAQNGNNSSNDILLYYIIFGISLLIVLRVISLVRIDRKSTRLNSSHVSISYAVSRLKK